MKTDEVYSRVNTFKQSLQKIRGDNNLSDIGRERALKNLRESINVSYPGAVDAFRGAWDEVRKTYRGIQETRAQAEGAESERWDYQKLNYETNAARERIKGVRTSGELASLYEQVKGSGNREKWRAWAEVAQSHLQVTGSLAAEMKGDLERLQDSPEKQKVQQAEDRLVNHAWNLQGRTDEVKTFYARESSYGMSSELDFPKAMKNIRLAEGYDSARLQTYRRLEVEDEMSENVRVDA